MKRFLPLLFAPALFFAQSATTPTPPTPVPVFDMSIERLAPEFDELIPPGTQVDKIAEGFVWSEGPVWKNDALYFSDVPDNKLYRWQPGGGKPKIFLQPSGGVEATPDFKEPGSNGLTIDSEGRLVLCQQGTRRVARLEAGWKQVPLVTNFEGKHFNSPNDVIFARSGNLYFTDPPYGLEGLNDSPIKELKFNGVFLVKPDGAATAVIRDLTFPNGLALSPDEKTLYIAVSDPDAPKLWAYDVQPDGSVTNRRLFFDATPLVDAERINLPDGMKIDTRGNVWVAAGKGILVLSPAGKHLGTIVTGQHTGNCAWGDDGSSLYICANMFIARVKTAVKGAGWK